MNVGSGFTGFISAGGTSKGAIQLERSSTLLTFLNQPAAPAQGDVAQVAFIGACFDGLELQPGVGEAPQHVRRASQIYANSDGTSQPITIFNPARGYLLDGIGFVDRGDIACAPRADVALSQIQGAIAEVVESGWMPLVVGGDHFITYPVVRALKEPVVVIHFDAHSDYLDELQSCPHGSFMRHVGELAHVKRIVHLGMRGNLQTGDGIGLSLGRGNALFTADRLMAEGTSLLDEILGRDTLAGDCATYVSFDVDVLDPWVAPATGTHEPGGLSYAMARDLLVAICASTRVIGMDFTEFNPRLDWNDITAKVVVNLIIEAVAAARGKGRRRIGAASRKESGQS